ncbi:MAG: type II toxin-antitoxin system Phd/YefM family antitoxin [Defluviicoccus sp.]|nr:type II toxin-antitoxin system Phd/YefM family antitoxin [Defluviicoccus sp.]MDE0278611.1 type II toxin-antitoxin system Phd/YefM family antitoxin [Defluviicoccus sp.]
MELSLREAKARLSELVSAARNGERVIITRHGRPAAELVRCDRRGGIDFDKLEETRRRLGIEDAPPEEVEAMTAALHDSALSRRVLGLEDEDDC